MNQSRIHKPKEKRKQDREEIPVEGSCCEDPRVENKKGEVVCVHCGTVHERDIVALKRRAYTAEEVEKRRITEPRWRRFGPRTTIPSATKEDRMSPERKTLFSRLSKIQKSLVSSIERNFWEARPKLKMLTSMLNIPKYIEETAWKIYAEAAKKQLTLGRTIKGFVAAALYAAIRVHEYPRILDEICDAMMISRHKVIKSLGLIIKKVLPELGLKYHPITPKKLIYRFGNEADMSLQIQKKAYDLLKKTVEAHMQTGGKDPRGFAAAALYMAAKSTPDQRTQSEMADIAGITEVTLRNRLKDLRKYI
ncbi:MAG: Transcription initiation factor IIB [Promethearchaeota archaeon]|nr:MAG: Transcription initiation factor IIB [Candidatus Lokiarchaeota archaeon]